MKFVRVITKVVAGLAFVLVLVVMAVGALSQFDPRFRVSDWRVMIHAVTGLGAPPPSVAGAAQGFVLREGLAISVYAPDVPKARMLRLTSAGDLLVSQPRLGQVTLLGRDANHDGLPDRQEVLISGLDRPHGLDIHDGWLYIAEGGAVGRVPFDAATGKLTGAYQTIVTGIPSGENHWTRTLRVGSDGWVYLTIGSSCNVCIETHEWRAAMIRFHPDGSGVERYAHGLRNSVGFDWAPWSGDLYATDNGRDLLGDDFPPCELNRIEAGGFYGWPHLNGFGVTDPDFGAADAALLKRAISPVHGFAPHNAPLGMSFLRAPANTVRFGRAALVALHGSWNRTSPDGYKLALLQWDESGKIRQSDFLTGFIVDGTARGRPVDVVEAPDGSLFVSDDYANAIYRIGPADSMATTTAAVSAKVLAPVRTPEQALAGVSAAERAAAGPMATALMQKHGCLGCHAPGTPLAAKWSNLNERYSLTDLTDYFLTPTPPMPVFPLSPDERRALAIHLLDRGMHP